MARTTSVQTSPAGRTTRPSSTKASRPGGLFTGAEDLKSEAHAEMFGGVAGASLAPCYHQRCDSLTPGADGADADLYAELDQIYDLVGNVNRYALGHNADAVAYSVGTSR